jgi:predicted nucleotidyltransferase
MIVSARTCHNFFSLLGKKARRAVYSATMNASDLKIARELKKRLSGQTDLIDFKVYGSRARGDADESSDMDVFVEVATLSPEIKEKIYELSWELGFLNGLVISPLIVSQHEIEKTALRSSSIIKNIVREGVAV